MSHSPNLLKDPDTGLPVLEKRPVEQRIYQLDFTTLLSGSIIASVTSVTFTNMGKVVSSTDITLEGITFSSRQVQVTLGAGQDLENYQITARIVDVTGNALQGDGMLHVRAL